MRIDSHQHFWTLSRGDYGWMSPELDPIYRDFGPDDLAPLMRAAGIDKSIVVQAADTVAETEFLLGLADKTDSIAGVVGWVDMSAPDAIQTLEKLAQNPHFKGIRPMIQDIAEDEWILRPELDATFQALVEMNLSFDALVLPRHLPHLLTRLARHPDLNCVIDHAAKPELKTGNLTDWRANMSRLAQDTDALGKFSGLVTEAHPAATASDLAPATDHVIAEFGASRLMFGSDWPVLNLASDYQAWVDMADAITGFEGDAAKAFWGGNAAGFYSVTEPAST